MDTQDLPGQGEPVTSSFISGGASNEIFAISRGDFRSVLRRPPRVVPQGPQRDDAPRVPGARGAQRHRRAPPRGLRGLRRHRGHRVRPST